MEMTVTRLPDGGVRYESDKAIVTIYERGRYIRDGKFTEEGLKTLKEATARLYRAKAQKERSA